MTWYAQLTGEAGDLHTIAKSLVDPETHIAVDGQNCTLTSDSFTATDDASEVHERAQAIVARLNGAVRLVLDSREPIRITGLYRRCPNGQRETLIFPEPIVCSVRVMSPTIVLTRLDGSVEEFHPADPVRLWMKAALREEAVGSVLQICARADLDWVNLYRIYEIICHDSGGVEAVVSNGWGTKKSIEPFKRTANHPTATGLEARHGVQSTQPPARPMELAEARSLIGSMIHAWLREKTRP